MKNKPTPDKGPFTAFCLQVLQNAFPRRKFETVVNEDGTYIKVVGAYTFAQIMSTQTMQVVTGARSWTASRSNCIMKFQWAFELETEIRKRQSHQRQQLKIYQAKLQQTEMLLDTEVSPVPFQHFYKPATLKVTLKDLPDDVIAEVRFNRYREVNNHADAPFTVIFGAQTYSFTEFDRVVSFFDSCEVFKETDRKVKEDQIVFITAPGVPSGRVAVRREELRLLAPYLLIMDAKEFEIRQVCLTTTADGIHHQDVPALKAMWPTKRKYEDYVVCWAHKELRWRPIPPNVALAVNEPT